MPTTHVIGEDFFSVRQFLSFAKKFATVRPCRRTRPPFVGSALALRMKEPRNLVRAATGPLTAATARKKFSFGGLDLFFGRAGRLKAVKVWN